MVLAFPFVWFSPSFPCSDTYVTMVTTLIANMIGLYFSCNVAHQMLFLFTLHELPVNGNGRIFKKKKIRHSNDKTSFAFS